MAEKRERRPAVVARRFAAMRAKTPAADHGEGVQPLALGYFDLQRMREFTTTKKKAKQERRTLHSAR